MKNRKKGFTIVELVIVIAVIGILSAILIPTFAGLTARAQEKALQEGLRNSYVAYSVDYADKEGYVAEKDVYLSEDAELDENSKVYKLDVADGVWKPVNVKTAGEGYVNPAPEAAQEGLRRVQVKNQSNELVDAPAYNGYVLYVVRAA